MAARRPERQANAAPTGRNSDVDGATEREGFVRHCRRILARAVTGAVAGFVLLVSFQAMPAAAEDAAKKPKTPFSGDMVVKRPGKRAVSIRMYYGTTHIRLDSRFFGRTLVTIVDRFKREIVLLLPHRREFMRVPSSARARAAIDRLIGFRSGLKPVGSETVGGVATTKYRVDTRTAAGTRFNGHIWLTSDNIMIQTIGRTPKGKIHIVMNNLRRGAVNPALFVIPAGYAERKPGTGKKTARPDR